MDFYTPKNEYDQITFSDFVTTSHTPLPPNIQVMCIFSFYKNYNFDMSILYQGKSFYIPNFNTSILPSKGVDVALLLPYSCPTPNLPYTSEDIFDQIEDLQIYQNFWKIHTLTTCHTKNYTYDPKYALGAGGKWDVYGNFEVFECFFKNLLTQYKDIIVTKSFWTLHGFFDISKKFRNQLFKKQFPTLNWAMEKRTICFNHISKKQRVQKIIQFFEKKHTTSQHEIKNTSFDSTPCSFASIHISGIIHWMQDFETLQEYLCTGGQIKWNACNEICDPSIVTICPHSFLDLLENKEKLRILMNT